MGYATTLIVILIMTNLMLYVYGLEIPMVKFLDCKNYPTECLGGQSYNLGDNPGEPTGGVSGGLGSSTMIFSLVLILLAAITAGGLAGISPSIFSGDNRSNFTIPLAIFACLLVFMVTPMGTIIGDVGDGNIGENCYTMRAGVTMFNTTMEGEQACLPSELHMLLILFLGMLMIAAAVTFVSGRDF